MSSNIYDKCTKEDGARPYKCRDYTAKISTNLQHFKRDGRFCDIDLISGKTRVKVSVVDIFSNITVSSYSLIIFTFWIPI
jgi:hypothetical protein